MSGMLPYRNAVLTTVTPWVTTADYDVVAGSGTAKWTGRVGIYVNESINEIQSGNRVDLYVRTRLELPYDIGRLVAPNDNVVYEYEGTQHTRIVLAIAVEPLVDRVRLMLEDA